MKDNMTLHDQLKCLIGGYHGVSLIDEYPLKEYMLKEIEIGIENFKRVNHIDNADYKNIEEEAMNLSNRTKMQDALLVLNSMNAPMDLVFMIKNRLKEETKKA